MKRIVIDGNIGAGKTTQLNLLDKAGWLVKREPIEEWPLAEFYKDRRRWGFLLQIRILQTLRPESHQTIYERSLLSTRHVFWEHMKESGFVTDWEDKVYCKAYERYEWLPDLYIFLSRTPEKAYEAIQKRGQTGDKSVTLKYIKELDKLYERLVRNVPCKVYVVNADRTPDEVHQEILSILKVNGVYITDQNGSKVQTSRNTRGQVLCTPGTDMCSVS